MGFEVPIDVDLPNHPKTLRLKAVLRDKGADSYVLRLICWAAKYARNGKFKSAGEVEEACQWEGDPGKLHTALVESGWLENDWLTIHDWMEHAGRAIHLYEKKKKNQRAKYAAKCAEEKGRILDTSEELFQHNSGENRKNAGDKKIGDGGVGEENSPPIKNSERPLSPDAQVIFEKIKKASARAKCVEEKEKSADMSAELFQQNSGDKRI